MKKISCIAALCAAFVLAGCSSVSLDESAKEGTTQSGRYATSADAITPEALAADKSVYFDFDSYTVQTRYYPTIDRREYNLALGQKRSEAVKGLMQIRGVAPNRLEAVSFGRERPVDRGENEQAWAKNRRADIVVSH